MQRMKDRNFRDLCYLINKPPRWNEQVGAYVLNFSGRVTMASVKNFQLVDPDEQNAVVLQFGRVGKDQFTMDMQWPMSPFQVPGTLINNLVVCSVVNTLVMWCTCVLIAVGLCHHIEFF